MTQLVELLTENAIKATILACLVALIAMVPRVRNLTHLQHSLWGLVLLAMISPAVIKLPLLSMPRSADSIESNQETSPPSNVNAKVSELKLHESHVVFARASSQNVTNAKWVIFTAIGFVGTVSIGCIAVLRVRRVRGMIRLANLADAKLASIAAQAAYRLGIQRQIRVVVIDANTSPFIWIELQTINIVLPQSLGSLSDERLLCIMLHELSHFQRRDHWANAAGFLVLAICWWNPVSWIAFRKMRALQEYCCDAMAIANSRMSRREYAECLFQITEFVQSANNRLPASACELFGQTSSEERFKMLANTRICYKTTKTSVLIVFLVSTFLPCTIAYTQAEKQSGLIDQGQQARDAEQSRQWHEIVERFNRLVTEKDWTKAEQLANETASKFGHDDSLIQNMLLTSINGTRKSQGLAPIIVQRLIADPRANDIQQIVLYRLKDILPKNEADQEKFVEILLQCVSASIANVASVKPDAKVAYDVKNQGLVVLATKPQHKLAAEIIKRIGQPRK